VRSLIAEGRIVLFTTRMNGKLLAFALVSLHNERAMPFANLDFVAVCKDLRGKYGIGTRLVNSICRWLQVEHSDYSALTIEISRRGIEGLSKQEAAQREARARFYTRLGASQMNVDYYILSFDDVTYRAPAEFWAISLNSQSLSPAEAVFAFYTSKAGYALEADNPAVAQVMSQFATDSQISQS